MAAFNMLSWCKMRVVYSSVDAEILIAALFLDSVVYIFHHPTGVTISIYPLLAAIAMRIVHITQPIENPAWGRVDES